MSQSIRHIPSRPQPAATAESRSFWDGAALGELRLRRCCGCGRLAAPLAPRCAGCLGDIFTHETLSARVALVGRTILHLQPFPGWQEPLVIVECAIEEDPRIILLALDQTGATESAAPGTPLVLDFPPAQTGARFATIRALSTGEVPA